jgi:fructose-specific phosphotransferase system component IIB
MKFITFLLIGILLATTLSCGSKNPESTVGSVEEAEKVLAKRDKKQQKAAKKAKKEAYKRYWSQQSKEAKKSIKKNLKRQKRIARHRKKSGTQ